MNMFLKESMIWVVTYKFGAVKAGPVIRFMRYASYFNKAGLKICFITIEDDKPIGDENPLYDVQGINANSPADFNNKVLSKLNSTKLKPKAIIFLSLDFYSFFHLMYSRKHRVPLIYVSTMKFDMKYKAYGVKRNIIMQHILKYFYFLTFNQLDYIVCSSSQLATDYLNIGVNKNKLKVIFNGVDGDKFYPALNDRKSFLRKKYGLPLDRPLFLFVGLFIERKGVDYLLNLWEKYKQTNLKSKAFLWMVGDEMLDIPENSQHFKSNWPRMRKEFEDRQDIKFNVFETKIDEVYQCADYFIFPSKLEGMPNVLLEAMSSGLPVLLNKFDGFSTDYGEDEMHYKLLSYNIDDEINKLHQFEFNREFTEFLAKNALIKMQSDFSLNKSISDYLSLF